MHRTFNSGVEGSNPSRPTKWMNSSTVELWLVKLKVKSSNLFSSAIGALAETVLLHWFEKPDIRVQFPGAPHSFKKLK